MDTRVNERQLEVLRWVVEGCPDGRWPEGNYTHKTAAVALQNRRLVEIRKASKTWTCVATEAGVYYAEHGEYPEGHLLSRVTGRPVSKPEAESEEKPKRRPGRPKPVERAPLPEWEVDSPKNLAARGKSARTEADEDPWQDRVLISVKKAAWLLDMAEDTIRRAVTSGDIQRVWIGEGTTNYRVVYDSLLAWVDSMPREPRPGPYAFWHTGGGWR